ncbi:MAG: S9 family peptidase, partial [Gemmatimonadaceae bacterium]|nr:S9 family peptidase [Gemmatimonadaceae bacterium]
AAPAATAPGAARGTDVVVHELSSSRSLFLGSVGDVSFNRQGDLLAYTVDAQLRDGNGLFLIDLRTGRTHVLDNDTLQYNRLTWSDDGERIAVLKGRPVERMRERANQLLALSGLRTLLDDPEVTQAKLDPASAAGFPKGFVVSERAPLTWSEDGGRVFLGIMPQTAAPDTGRRPGTDSVANVDVWRTQDERIQSAQMIRAEADRNFTFRQAFDVRESRFIPLTDSTMRELEVSLDGRWAVGRDPRAYVHDWQRPAADFYRVNTATGERTLMFRGQLTQQFTFGISPDGRQFLYWKDNRYQAYDLDAGVSRTLGSGANGFVNLEYDYPGPKPAYGVAGYTPDGRGVIVQQRYDLVLLSLDGSSAPRNLTAGAGARREIRYRVARTEPVDSAAPRRVRSGREIDLSKPVTLTTYGEYTKKSGFSRLEDGAVAELVFDDAAYSTPVRADRADRYLLTRQTFAEFPDLRVSGPTLADARRISDANPQQAEFIWGRRVLFDYRNRDGVRLQGILALPDDYKAGEKRPMIVSFYEKNSQNMHRYTPPSFITGMGTIPVEALSRGYITMYADIHFRTGSSHSDMLEGVEAATRKVIELGYADPKKIAVHGHSYGGEGAAFIGTRSKLFAAVGMGAGVTDLYSDFSQSWGWTYQVTGGSGENGNSYYMFGQGRWGKSPWDAPELYRFESALAHAPNANQPFLIMHGTADPTVSFTEGMNFYNALRFNRKEAVMLAYPGEGHGLRGLANRRDLTIRYFQFFDHYLKGAPAPKWIVVGNEKRAMVMRARVGRWSSVDAHPAQFEHVVRPLHDADVRLHHPGQRAAVQRNQRQVLVHQPQRVADELAAAREVRFDADRVDQRVELRVRVASAVERAAAGAVVGAHGVLQHRPRVGAGRPAELEEARGRLRELRKEDRAGRRLEVHADADLREHRGDRLAHRRPERDVDAVERDAEAFAVAGFLQQRARLGRVVRQTRFHVGRV